MEVALLLAAVISVAVLHTLVPDHYLPISMIAQARRWSTRKTIGVTMLAGSGHILASLIIGALAIYVSVQFSASLASRAETLAKAMLIGFGLFYTVFALGNRWGGIHYHHAHHQGNAPIPAIVLILSLMPCIPVIPLFISASLINTWTALFSMLVFSFFTITTMLAMVLLTAAPDRFGLLPPRIKGSLDVISGLVIFATGVLITLFDLKPRRGKTRTGNAIVRLERKIDFPQNLSIKKKRSTSRIKDCT